MLDKFFAIISMLMVIAFMAVVTLGVMEPDLWIVTLVVLSVGIMYFWDELKAGASHFEDKVVTDEGDK